MPNIPLGMRRPNRSIGMLFPYPVGSATMMRLEFHPGHYKVCPPEDFQMYCATVFFNLEVSELGREFRVGPPQLVIIPEDF